MTYYLEEVMAERVGKTQLSGTKASKPSNAPAASGAHRKEPRNLETTYSRCGTLPDKIEKDENEARSHF